MGGKSDKLSSKEKKSAAVKPAATKAKKVTADKAAVTDKTGRKDTAGKAAPVKETAAKAKKEPVKAAAAKKTVAAKAPAAKKPAAATKAAAAKKTVAAKPPAAQKSPVSEKKSVCPAKTPEAAKVAPVMEKVPVQQTAPAVEKKSVAPEMAKNAPEMAENAPVVEKKPAQASRPKARAVYDESQVKHLDALEHIRLRSGMYIGRLGDGSNQNDGIYVLLKEIVDNAVDEFIMGYGDRIDVEVKDGRVKVRDFGRGIPLGKVVECVSEINTGAKYNDDVFQFSVGMNGVGTKAVNALSSYFRVVSIRDGKCAEAVFQKGVLASQKSGTLKEKQRDGTYFEFVPDEEIFGKYTFNMEFVEKRMWNYAYLNSGLTVRLNGQDFKSENGLLDLLSREMDDSCLYSIGSYSGERLKFAFTHTNSYGENYFSFVNGQYTADGGTHLAAFKEGFVRGLNDFYGASYKAEDIREGMTAAVLVKVKDPVFESQTKNKLGNTDIRQWIVGEVQSGLNDWLHRNPDAARKIQEKILANEKLRTELSAVKKEAKEAAKKISIRIPKLKDCKYHVSDGAKGENSMIFITEGDSASGTMTHSRDASYQAIFSLRGKPENMWGKKQGDIYKNDELYQLMMALGIENSVEDLKYSKIVIATDADNDGYHIRNLVMTFFLDFFEELVTSGRVFILETPLFRVRNKKENVYCYSETERDKAQERLGKSAETSRFKGLGEINPDEFRQFIEPETMHLTPVEISQLKAVPKLLTFYMGKNTPERRSFIEKHLLSNADIDA